MQTIRQASRALMGASVSAVLVASAHAVEVGPVLTPYGTMRLDVAPGYIKSFRTSMDIADERGGQGASMTVHFEKLQPSEKWEPMFSLCVVSATSVRSECIRLASSTDSQVLDLESASKSKTSDYVPSPLEPLSPLPKDEAVRVSMRLNKDRLLTFAINGSDVHSLTLDFDASEYEYACSSMVCDLTWTDILAPKETPPTQTISHADIQLLLDGRVALAQGDFDLAIDKFSRFIEVAPNFPVTYPERARAWIGKGQPARALADLEEALKVESEAKLSDSNDNVVIQLFYLGSNRPQVEALRNELRAKLSAVSQAR